MVSNRPIGDNVAHIHQDMTMYLSQLEAGNTLTFTQEPNRRIFLFVIEGDLTMDQDMELTKRDSARVTDTTTLTIQTKSGAHFLLIDLC
jgi:quercetin 2,3-dioxygenase